jgi:hypothetical protein
MRVRPGTRRKGFRESPSGVLGGVEHAIGPVGRIQAPIAAVVEINRVVRRSKEAVHDLADFKLDQDRNSGSKIRWRPGCTHDPC